MPAAGGVVRVDPLTAKRWDDAVVVFGSRGDPASCWCHWFRLGAAQWRASTTEANRRSLQEQAAEPTPPGLLAYAGAEPAGWVALAPRARYPRLGRHRALTSLSGPEAGRDEAVWSVTCFVVRVGFRRKGVAAALLAQAVRFAADHGARTVEGYPVDIAAGGRRAASELYHGTASMFAAAGFREVGRTAAARPVMRLELA